MNTDDFVESYSAPPGEMTGYIKLGHDIFLLNYLQLIVH